MKTKTYRSVFVASIFFSALIAPICFMSPVNATAQVNILTHSGWIDLVGHYHISGEVENVGDSAASFVKIAATLYDSGDIVVVTSFTYTTLDILLPGRKSPFEALLINTGQAAKVDHYSLAVAFSTTSPIPIGLEIPSSSSYVDVVNYMHVVGEIENIESETATFVQVAATFYNATGNVVATSFAYSDPRDIGVGQKAPFEVLLTYTNRVSLVDSYTLTAESNQYAIVPEFPTWTSIALVFTILASAMVIYKWKLFKTPIH